VRIPPGGSPLKAKTSAHFDDPGPPDAGRFSDDAGSVASSSQASGSEALDAGTAASAAEGEDELVADWRRAKRCVASCRG
jgi:hypothetical protein